ncbi:hypothetical protein JNMOADIG_00100 [Aeromonas phage avDM5]|uniref:Uncharacterized protein n=1 Tax=Aeromonas phage vB_AehM_DM2 TaxID=2973716 RepID=A0AA95C400_9CAUD|nr:hypothetical protein JNMOADIG_00100 [Aeromonas phage avDM5]UYD60397.1 hypothetical protein NPHMPGLK_00062 [Aeromonas phage avDM2]UYD60767.1 hypothetical protein NHNEHLNL_00171 [Aeromonas phage avDM2]
MQRLTLKFTPFEPKDDRNTFMVKMHFSDKFSDATLEYEIPAIDADRTKAEIVRLITFMDKCKAEYPRGKGGQADFNHIPDYYRYFGEEAEGVELWEEYGVEGLCWPCHECDYPKNFKGYEIIYTGPDGNKFKVAL